MESKSGFVQLITAMNILEVSHISYMYPHAEKKAVNNVSFSLEKGSYTAILGPNGSGKSTLARIAAGILDIQEGSIQNSAGTFFEPVRRVRKKNIEPQSSVPGGIVFQSPKHQIIAGKVIKDVQFGPENLGFVKKDAEQKAKKELLATSLEHKENENTLSLSLGQTQKLALSGILALNPDVLILDESVSMIDPECRLEILDYIDRLHAEGKTILSVTHDLDEALRADRIFIMNEGSLVFSGSKDEFTAHEHFKQDIFGTENITERKNPSRDKKRAAVRLDSVYFGYKDNFLENFSLSFEQGTITAVMGESGSGKSTIFELIAGLLEPSAGTAASLSTPSLALQDSEGALFEEFAVDDAAFGPRNKGLQGKALLERVKTAMNTAGLEYDKYKNKKTFSLSGGEKRKLALAGIIALDEDIMLFDEPTAGLDPKSRLHILSSLQSLADAGKTVIFSTHRKEETHAADRTIVLHNGRISYDSDPFISSSNDGLASHSVPQASILSKIRSGIQGDYADKKTILHAAHPGIKFFAFVSLFTISIAVQDIFLLSIITGLCLVYSLTARYPLLKMIKRIAAVLPWLGIFFVFQMLFFGTAGTDKVFWEWAFISITEAKIQLFIRTVLHFLAAVITFSVYFYSTEESDIVEGIASVLKPAALLGFPARHLCLLILLVLRFIPLLLDETSNIVKTQIIRQGIKKRKGLFKTIRSFIPLFVPLLLQTLKRAELLTEAITARYYH